ncbi:MAG: hypothetical protein IT479_10075 [Xanthomonadales bacterium]|nr:hypothetical protein [Xanthomonadales bacterium]MCC6593608.1 hypothetical protein [Xanthomonadales bacterium]MCE7930326.1 hypothetical protein [Xanthomonadales bacterium PRO6]
MRFVSAMFAMAGLLGGMSCGSPVSAQLLPSFPGAEGFGAVASGGRGGQVLFVDTLAADPNGNLGSGNRGSLNWALRQPGARTIVFEVSGVIDGPVQVRSGNVTIAGQTSPGGVIVRGLSCGVHYGGQNCDNLIVRHLRLRPACQVTPGNCPHDDALRLDGVQRVMIDHVSMANANDEALQLSWASEVTIQNSILAETEGGHAIYGGILLNYANTNWPQDGISIVRNLFYRIKGRLPEINCESSAQDDIPPRLIDACQNVPLRLEVSNNYYFDPYYYVTYARWVDGNSANGPYRVRYNMVANHFHVRPDFPYGMVEIAMLHNSQNSLYVSDNWIDLYPGLQDYALFYCCNDFSTTLPSGNTDLGSATRHSTRHSFPAISYVPTGNLLSAVVPSAGARPHDPMDRRITASALGGTIPNIPHEQPLANDALTLDFPSGNPPPAPPDGDEDGMPDAFELAHGLNPNAADHNGSALSLPLLGVAGYTNLEVYLELLARGGDPERVFKDGFEGG